MKEMLLLCTKNHDIYIQRCYIQRDVANMGSSLGPVLAGIGAIALLYPPSVRVRAAVKLSAAFFS